METGKIIKKIAIGLICVSAVALIGLNIYQHQQIKRFSQGVKQEATVTNGSTQSASSGTDQYIQEGVAQRTIPAGKAKETDVKEIREGITLAGKGKEPDKDEIDDLSYQLDAAEEELEMVNKQLSDEEAKKAERKKIQSELQKRSMQDPSLKKSMRNSLERQYTDLFKELALSPEKEEKFKDLLVDEMMAQQNIYLEMGADGDTLSKEEQEEMSQRYMALNKEYETKKSELLGEDDYEIYQAYTERSMERYNVTSFIESLAAGEKLTETQKEELIDAMYEERKNIRYEVTDNDDSESSLDLYSEKSIARIMEFQGRRDEVYLNAAKNILSASQTEQFKTYLKQQRDMMESSIRLQALRYSTQKTEKSDDEKSE